MSTLPPDHEGIYVDGSHERGTGETLTVNDPATANAIAALPTASATDVDRAVTAASDAFPAWRDTDPATRGRLLHDVAARIRDDAAELARLVSLDQGKPLSQARSEVESAATYVEYYAGVTDKLEGRTVPTASDEIDFTTREPYGVSAQIVPWNYPVSLFARGVGPALAAGNTVVAKPAPTTPLATLSLAGLLSDAGIPDGVCNVVTGGAEPGAALTSHEGVDTITFTGSVSTGQTVMEAAAAPVTPVTLELGGKNPAIVFPDADVEEAVEAVSTGIFTNAGQICSAADRALVHESIYDEFLEAVVAAAESYDLGPGLEDHDMGPLNHESHFESVLEYVEVGRSEGATVETGGRAPDGPGYFVEPTVFSDVRPEMRIATEEIFGPILVVIPFAGEQEGLEIANGVDFGLTAGLFTGDTRRALRLATEVEAGTLYVNQWFASATGAPFGGTKRSGIGREKGLEGLDSYLQTKTVSIAL